MVLSGLVLPVGLYVATEGLFITTKLLRTKNYSISLPLLSALLTSDHKGLRAVTSAPITKDEQFFNLSIDETLSQGEAPDGGQ